MSTEVAGLPEQMHSRSTAVATRGVDTTEDALDERDILIPRMKIGQKMSREVLEYGGIYVLASREDMEPQQIVAPPAPGELGEAVRFYVHGNPRKGWSWKPAVEGGEWRSKDYPDLRLVEDQDPRKVRRTYDYLITLPDYPELPVMFIMHGQWGGQGAKTINTQLLTARSKGLDSHTIAFKLQARKTSSPKGGQERPFVQAIVGLDKITAKDKASDLELVESHRLMIGSAENISTVDDDDTAQGSAVAAPPLD